MTVTTGRKPFILGFILVVLLLGGAVPAFSQEILTSFTVGYESSKFGPGYEFGTANPSGAVFAANVLFVGRGGLTVSGGGEFFTDFANFIRSEPVIGIGYVFYRGIYFGGLLNVFPRTAGYSSGSGNGVLAPTLVAGLDFGNFLVEARVSYLHAFVWGMSGFRVSLGVGTNVGGSE